jgi:hypothetical protein
MFPPAYLGDNALKNNSSLPNLISEKYTTLVRKYFVRKPHSFTGYR